MPGYILVKTMEFLATRLDVSLIQTKTDIKRQWTKGEEPGYTLKFSLLLPDSSLLPSEDNLCSSY